MSKKYELLFRLLLCGDSGVGKSCILWRFVDDDFNPNHLATIGIDFKLKTMSVDGKSVKIQCWDTAGQERYESLSQNYYRRAEGVILVYDITRRETFSSLSKWISLIRANAPEEVEVMLVGNKSDRQQLRQVTTAQGRLLAQANGFDFFETSAYSSHHVTETFDALVRRLLWRRMRQRKVNGDESHSMLGIPQSHSSGSRSAPSTPSASRRADRLFSLKSSAPHPPVLHPPPSALALRDPSPDSLLSLAPKAADASSFIFSKDTAAVRQQQRHAGTTSGPQRQRSRRPDSLISTSDLSSMSSESEDDLQSPQNSSSAESPFSPLTANSVKRRFFPLSSPTTGQEPVVKSSDQSEDVEKAIRRRSANGNSPNQSDVELAILRSAGARFSFCEAETTDLRRRSSLIRLERKLSGSLKRTDSGRSVWSMGGGGGGGACGKTRHDGACCKMA